MVMLVQDVYVSSKVLDRLMMMTLQKQDLTVLAALYLLVDMVDSPLLYLTLVMNGGEVFLIADTFVVLVMNDNAIRQKRLLLLLLFT
jgi:hypothetical protein